jgi:cytochrome P450
MILRAGRNQAYIDNQLWFNTYSVMVAGVVGGAPPALRPYIGPLVSMPVRLVVGRIKKMFAPLFEQRMQLIQRVDSGSGEAQPQDLLQMMLRFATTERPQGLTVDHMTKRLCMTNFGSIHQTSLAGTNLLLDVVTSDAEYGTVAALRAEVEQVVGANPAEQAWTRPNIARMVTLDSAIRESMRWHTFGNRSLMRMVVVDGLRTEDGVALPKGALVSVLMHPVHRDEDAFEEASRYDPLRYARLRSRSEAKAGNLSFVTTGPQFLPFGHGKHACPGRFVVDLEFKMLVACLLHNYDVKLPDEYGGRRPENVWVAEATMPPKDARIMVRRRPGTWP